MDFFGRWVFLLTLTLTLSPFKKEENDKKNIKGSKDKMIERIFFIL
jgi:hypothetical protein